MVNNIAQEDQEGGPNGKGQKYSRVYAYMYTCGYMYTLSLSLFSFRVKNERSDARVENRRTINRKEEEEGKGREEREREEGVSLVQEPPSQSAIEQFSLLWG